MRRPAGFRQALLIVIGALITAACGTGTASSAASSAAAVPSPSVVASGSPGGAVTAVELTEWAVVPAVATASAGPVSFQVTNAGTQVHEFVLVKTDMRADALPVVDDKIDESVLTPVDEIEDIAAGASSTLDVTLEPGHYVMLCNIETHYEQGMSADFDVQ